MRAGAPLEGHEEILDFGCGCGCVLLCWHDLDARVCGTGISGPAIKMLGINVHSLRRSRPLKVDQCLGSVVLTSRRELIGQNRRPKIISLCVYTSRIGD